MSRINTLSSGSRQDVSIVIADLRRFTELCDNLEPPNLMVLVNGYFAAMNDVIDRYQGKIVDILGDSIMAYFTAPALRHQHSASAIACAIDMHRCLKEVNSRNTQQGLPALQMGIGINSGPVVIGNIKLNKTTKTSIMGMTVKIASQIESFTTGGQVLVSEAACNAASVRLDIKESFDIFPKGASQSIKVFDVVGVGDPYCISLDSY